MSTLEKRPVGRPKKDPEEVYGNQIKFYVDNLLTAKLEYMALASEKSKGRILRELLTDAKIPTTQ